MQKTDSIIFMAKSIINSENKIITPNELEILLANADNQTEKELYLELYNFFLRKKSEEVIKNGKF